jgi:hypothetical protein
MANEEGKSRESIVEGENRKTAEEAEENKTDEQREEEKPVHDSLDNMPEGKNYVGLLEYEVNPDPAIEMEKQQAENFPRVQTEAFRPEEHEVEDIRDGMLATHRSLPGCREVIVEEDLLYDDEVIKAGVQPLPTEVADKLISDGMAFEPAGKKRGR